MERPARYVALAAFACAAGPMLLAHACAPTAVSPDAACACTSEQAGGDSGLGTADGALASVTGFVARQWVSSESCPFSLAEPNADWFACPHPILHMLERSRDLPITMRGDSATIRIDVDPSVSYQTLLGTGISMEESSVHNLLALPPAKRAEVLVRMVDPVAGVGMNLFRVTMGTSDFTGSPWYTYDDLPPGVEDPNLDHFSIQKDVDLGILDVLRQMLALRPDILFFASPWSPPAWMKDNGQITGGLFGGSLRSDKIGELARYFRKFVEAYRAEGVPIYAVTLQNEPLATSPFMPTCLVAPEQEALLVRAIKAEFAEGQIDTRVWVYDQNFDVGVAYVKGIFQDPAARSAADGVAFHDYAGDPSALSALRALYPEKDMLFTEKTLWGVAGMDRAAQYFRNGARSYVAWVTMLDQNGLPNNGPNSEKPRRFVRSLTFTGDAYYPTPEYYLFGLYSKFVLSGAKRIESTYGSPDRVTDVAFLNPDGTVAAVVMNQTASPQPFVIRSEGNEIAAILDAKSACALVWRSGLGPSDREAAAP